MRERVCMILSYIYVRIYLIRTVIFYVIYNLKFSSIVRNILKGRCPNTISMKRGFASSQSCQCCYHNKNKLYLNHVVPK